MFEYMYKKVCEPQGYCVFRRSKKIGKDLWKFVYVKKEELPNDTEVECFFCSKKVIK